MKISNASSYKVVTLLGTLSACVQAQSMDPKHHHHRKAYLLNPTEQENGLHRVWVHYKEGQHDACLHSLHLLQSTSERLYAAAATTALPSMQLHYDFAEYDAFVLTVDDATLRGLETDPFVDEIVQDSPRYPMYIPESVRVHRLLEEEVPYGIRAVEAEEAWNRGATGQGVKVCVIDSGIDSSHPDFEAGKLTGLQGTAATGPWSEDGIGHGTHCSGTVAASRNNGIGVVGVAPDAEIYTVKVFSDNGSFSYASGLVDAANRCRDAGAKIISMSLGGPLWNPFEFRAFERLLGEGVLSIAAAGNSGGGGYSFPASYGGVISVGAVDSNKRVASFSQKNNMVDIVAPGVDVLSTLPTDSSCLICRELGVTSYGTISGTSMATPHVAGVAALLWSFDPSASVEDIQEALLTPGEDLGAEGRDNSYGVGLVSALTALETLNGGAVSPGDPPSSQGCEMDEFLVSIRLQTDNRALETYWQLARDSDSFPVLAGAGLEDNKVYETERCLPADCYTFAIIDAGTNGICCESGRGGYTVSVDGTEAGSGGDFGSSMSLSIGACGDSGGGTNQESLPSDSQSSAGTGNCMKVDLFLHTDSFPLETSVLLTNLSSGETLWDVSYSFEANREYIFTSCLDPNSCFQLSIEDSFGDGICCVGGDGYYHLYVEEQMVASGSDFGAEAVHQLGDGCV